MIQKTKIMASGPITSWEIDGHIQNQRHYFANKCQSSQSYGFSSSHVWMWELDSKESWALKDWCFWIVMLEKTHESPLDCKEIKPGNSKGNQGLELKLKLQNFGPLMQRTDSFKRPWCWERLKAGGGGNDRGWHGWVASLTRLTWVWVSSGSWWWTGRPGMLQSTGSQRVGHDWTTELTDISTLHLNQPNQLIHDIALYLTWESQKEGNSNNLIFIKLGKKEGHADSNPDAGKGA